MVQNVATRRWTVDELYRLVDAGVFAPDERIELIEGEIVSHVTQGPDHSWAITAVNHAMVGAYGKTHFVRVQCPLELSAYSEPEPDIAVVPRTARAGAKRHKLPADLVIEVALTSLRYDRAEKLSMYAKTGVREYWIVNVKERVLEVHLDPAPDPEAPYGFSYATRRLLTETQKVNPSFLEGPEIAVRDLLEP